MDNNEEADVRRTKRWNEIILSTMINERHFMCIYANNVCRRPSTVDTKSYLICKFTGNGPITIDKADA